MHALISRPSCDGRLTGLENSGAELLGVQDSVLDFLALGVRQRGQATLRQVAVSTERAVRDVFRQEFVHVRDDVAMRVLDVEEDRTRDRVGAVSDGVEGRRHVVDLDGLQLVRVLVEERVAEDADRVGVGFEALDDQVVVFAGFDEWAVLAHARADLVPLVFVGLLEVGHAGQVLAAVMHDEFDEGVAGAGRRRRAEGDDRGRGQRRVDVRPHLVRVGDELAVGIRNLGGEGLEDLLFRQVHVRSARCMSDRKAVDSRSGLR